MDIAIVGAGTVGTAVGVAWVGRRSSHRRGRGPAGDRLARRDVAAGCARVADRRGGVRSGARGDRRARRGAAGDRVDGGEHGDPRRRRPASVRRQRARCARARRGGRRPATRRTPAADLRRRCGCARGSARLCRRRDGGRRRRVRARRDRLVAISAAGRSVCRMPSAPCITRPRCSRRTIWSPFPAPPKRCSPRAGRARGPLRRCGRSRTRRSTTCTGWGREPRSPAPRSAATPGRSTGTSRRSPRAAPALVAAYVTLCRAAMTGRRRSGCRRRPARDRGGARAMELMRDAAGAARGGPMPGGRTDARSGSCRRWARCTRGTRR